MVYTKVVNSDKVKCRLPSDWNKSVFIKKSKIVLLYKDKELIGNCAIKNGWITYFVIHPDFRNKGYGSVFLNEVEKIIKKSYNRAFLIPQDNKEELVEFYSKNGYVHVISKENPAYEEEDKDCWVMYKRLRYEFYYDYDD